jgi:hypothetical protein
MFFIISIGLLIVVILSVTITLWDDIIEIVEIFIDNIIDSLGNAIINIHKEFNNL